MFGCHSETLTVLLLSTSTVKSGFSVLDDVSGLGTREELLDLYNSLR